MKVLAFNSSPRKEKSVSEIVMSLFLEGAGEAGAETESHYVCYLDVEGVWGVSRAGRRPRAGTSTGTTWVG